MLPACVCLRILPCDIKRIWISNRFLVFNIILLGSLMTKLKVLLSPRQMRLYTALKNPSSTRMHGTSSACDQCGSEVVVKVGRWNTIRPGLAEATILDLPGRVRRGASALILSPVLCCSNPAHDLVETDTHLARGHGGLTQADVAEHCLHSSGC